MHFNIPATHPKTSLLVPRSTPGTRRVPHLESLPLWPTWADGLQVPEGEAVEGGVQQQEGGHLRQAEDILRWGPAQIVPLRPVPLLLQQRQALTSEAEGHGGQQALGGEWGGGSGSWLHSVGIHPLTGWNSPHRGDKAAQGQALPPGDTQHIGQVEGEVGEAPAGSCQVGPGEEGAEQKTLSHGGHREGRQEEEDDSRVAVRKDVP